MGTRPAIDRRHRNLALLVAGCFFMDMLDGTIVTTSAPRIAHSLGVSVGSISVVITAYLVTLATLIPLGGWLSARFGARRIFLAAIAVFTVASLGCALSQSLGVLIAMRVLQGLGGAMMVPVGRLVVLSNTKKQDLMRVTAYIVWPALIAPVFAPVLGGLITTYASWHWLFLINVPLGTIAFIISRRIVPSPAQPPAPRLDTIGVLFVCTGLAGTTVTAALLARVSPAWILDACFGVPSLLLLGLATRHLLRSQSPLIELRTLRIPTLRTGVVGSFVYFTVTAAGPFLAPLKFEQAFGWGAVKSGALVVLIFVGNIAIKPATTYLYGRFGFRTVLMTSTGTMAVTMAAVGFTTSTTPVPLIALLLLVIGVVRSVGATGYSTIAFTEVPAEQMSHANTLQATAQQLAAAFGVAGGAMALRAGLSLGHVFDASAHTGAPYTVAFVLAGLVALIATFDAARLQSSAGAVLRRAAVSDSVAAVELGRPYKESEAGSSSSSALALSRTRRTK